MQESPHRDLCSRFGAKDVRSLSLDVGSLMINQSISATADASVADELREIERSRLRALVARDMALAVKLHAPNFQLVTPAGNAFTREQYLGKIERGELRYLRWEPEEIAVRLHGEMAVLRYQAALELDSGNGQGTPFRCWHIDSYELNDSHWQVVWSQATRLK